MADKLIDHSTIHDCPMNFKKCIYSGACLSVQVRPDQAGRGKDANAGTGIASQSEHLPATSSLSTLSDSILLRLKLLFSLAA